MLRLCKRLRALFLMRRSADFVLGINVLFRAGHNSRAVPIVNGEPAGNWNRF